MNLVKLLKSRIIRIIIFSMALTGAATFCAPSANADRLVTSFLPDATYIQYWGSAVSHDGNTLYLVSNSRGILTLNISNPASIPSGNRTAFTTGIQGNSVALSPDGTKLFVASGNTGPAITVFDLSGNSLPQETYTVRNTDTNAEISGFFSVAVSADGRYVYTSSNGSPCLYRFKIDRSSGQEKLCMTGTRNGANFGGSLILGNEDLYLLGNRTSSNRNDQLIGVDISASTMAFKSESWTVDSYGGVLDFYKNGKYIYATTNGDILKIDVSNNGTTGNADIVTYRVPGCEWISSLFVTPDQKYAYLVDNWGYEVIKYDLVNQVVMTSPGLNFASNSWAWFLSYDPTHGLLVMTDDYRIKILKIESESLNVVAESNGIALAKIAEEARARQVATAKAEVTNALTSGKPITLEDLNKAEINGVTPRNIELVTAELAALPMDKRADIKEVLKVAYKFATVDKIADHSIVGAADLVSVGLIPADSKIKTSILVELKKLPADSIDTFAEIQAAIALVEKKAAERKARLASILTKVRR